MEKIARKPSADPIQEKLRQEKASWNKDVSSFFNDLIHAKKLMNGAPSKFHMEKSKIVEPIPADPDTILGSLTNEFQELAQRGHKIVQQQLDYSKNRRKRQPKQLNLPLSSAPGPTNNSTSEPSKPDLSKQLSLPLAASINYELVAEGSNPLSRFFARLLSPAIGSSPAARIRKYRMSLLTSSHNTYKDLVKLQTQIVKSTPESIFVSSKLLNKLEDQWVFLSQGFMTYRNSISQDTKDVGGKINSPKEESKNENKPVNISAINDVSDPILTEAEAAINDFRFNIGNFIDFNTKTLNNLVMQFSNAELETKKQTAPILLVEYKKLLSEINSKYNTNGSSLKQISDARVAQNVNQTDLKTVSQNALNRWFDKTKHQLSPFDKTSAFRLDVYKLAEECKKNVDKIMDLLESGMDIEALTALITKVGSQFISIRDIMRALDSTIRGKNFDQPFMSMLDRKNILDHNPNLSDLQKDKLQKLIEHRNLRDLTNVYMRK